ncbi:hypothetical protein ETB97_009126 [Aspergillus alliaceus]|uniref:Peptidase S8/S53 domain-containing protein n=1 Tax=Petromyces alliaceus TaxID=209559 RepID=A0A8H6E0V0_PETAA|nr:hypothetical protein ETB97_009126 [Aspergillus burnettii]
MLNNRSPIPSAPQDAVEDDEDIFPTHTIGEHHRTAIRKFRTLWKQNNGGSRGSQTSSLSRPSDHTQDSLQHEKTVKAFEDWLAEESKIAESLPKLGVYNQDFLSLLIMMGRKGSHSVALFHWVMKNYPDMCLRLGNRFQKQSLLVEANSKSWSKGYVAYFLQEYPAQTARMIEKDNSALLNVVSAMIDQDCSGPIFARLNPAVLATTDSQKNTLLHLVSEYGVEKWKSSEDLEQWNEKRIRLIHNLLTYCPYVISLTNTKHQSAYQHRIRTFGADLNKTADDESISSLEFDEEPVELVDDKILALLKEKIMSLNEHEVIISLLYGKIQKREIYLDLIDLENMKKAVSEATFKNLLRETNYESILKHVRIPSFEVTVNSQQHGEAICTGQKQQLVKKVNVEDIFNLLWEKGVRKIISISVHEDGNNPYSDEVIESLEKFDIEEWDWQRKDLCISVILKAAGNARKVSLYSTGNRSVLQSWSAPDGLISLEKLTDVNLLVQPRFESTKRTRLYLKEFSNKIHENRVNSRPPINVVTRLLPGFNGQTHIQGKDKAETSTWLENMDKFVSFVRNIPEFRRPTKVAVIDDGVDKLQEDFEDSIIAGVSFFSSQKDNFTVTRPYYFSSNGHGTLMAKTIRRLCPNVNLCIARLDQGVNGEPTVESAIKAISWATANAVDVISMSWTLSTIGDVEARKLRDVVEEAHDNGILTFASVSDQGLNQPEMSFPGKIPGVFRIGAARRSGVPDDFSHGYEFLFPGGSSTAKALQNGAGDTGANSEITLGSSFATAVASGLAALILDCVELCDLGDEYRNDLHQYQNMKDIFRMMSTNSPGLSYIEAEKWFPASFENMDWMEDEDQEEFRKRVMAVITPCIVNRPLGV